MLRPTFLSSIFQTFFSPSCWAEALNSRLGGREIELEARGAFLPFSSPSFSFREDAH